MIAELTGPGEGDHIHEPAAPQDGRPGWPVLVLVSACVGLTPFVFSPATIYFRNSYEFPFSFTTALPLLVAIAAATSAVVLLVLSLLPPGGRRWGVAIAIGGSVALWLQANVVAWRYGQLDGSEIDWGATGWRGWVDAAVWAVVILICIVGRRWIARNAVTVAVALLSVQLASAIVLAVTRDEDPWYLRNHFDFSKEYRFSSQRNVIVLLLDGLMTSEFARVTAEDPELAAAFDGFIYFRNAVADFSLTQGSLPAMLTAQRYEDSRPYLAFVKAAYTSRSSLPKMLKEHGYIVDVFGLCRSVWADPSVMSNLVSDPQRFKEVGGNIAFLADLGLFRSVPHTLTRLVYRHQSWLLSAVARRLGLRNDRFIVTLNGIEQNVAFKGGLARAGTEVPLESSPVFKFFHLQGPHPPLTIDENVQRANLPFTAENYRRTVHGSLKVAASLLDFLRKRGLYDNSLLLIVSDHGLDLPVVLPHDLEAAAGTQGPARQTRALPLVLVKPLGAHGPLHVSNAPVQLSDIPRTVLAQLRIDATGVPGADMFGLSPDSPRPRTFFSVVDQNWRTTRYMSAMTEFVASGFSWFERSWRPTGRVLGNYQDTLSAYRAAARVHFLGTPQASSSSGDEPVTVASNDRRLLLLFPTSQLDPKRGDWAAVVLPFEGLTRDTAYTISFDIKDDYANDRPDHLVQMVWFDDRLVYQHDLGAGTFTGVTPVEWRFRAASSRATLRLEVRYVGDLEPNSNWGLCASLALGNLRLEPVAAGSAPAGS